MRTWFRLGALGAAVLASVASNSPEGGERTDGECPAGETCSPDTPNGLYFGATPLGDEVFDNVVEPHRTAVGGRQTLTAWLDGDADTPFTGFQALPAGPAFEVVAATGNTIGVRGLATGTDYLRLVDPANRELYDRIALDVAEVADVRVVPNRLFLAGDKALYEAAKPAVVYRAGASSLSFVIALYDANGVRLVDETLQMTLGPAFERDASTWDRFRPSGALTTGDKSLGFGLGDGSTGSVSLTVVDAADDVTWVAGTGAGEDRMPAGGVVLGRAQRFCFRAENGGRPVIGATFAYAATPGLTVEATTSSCVNVTGAGVGVQTLTVTVDGVAVPFDVPVTATASKPTAAAAAPVPRAVVAPVRPRAGERAAVQASF
jgi:hypothetical protein